MLIDEADRTVSFGEFRDRSERVAAGLVGLGVTPDTPVAWQLPTRIESIVLSFALARLGTTQVPIIPIYREREVGSVLAQAGVKFFAVPGRVAQLRLRGDGARVCRRRPAARSRPSWSTSDTLPEGDPSTLPAPPTDGDAVRWLYSTSGTTAAPKCVMHSDGGLIAGGMGLAHALEVQPHDVGSIAFPCTHIGGPDYLVVMLAYGMPAVLLETFDPANAVGHVRAPRRHDGRRQHRVLPRVPQRAAQGPVEAGDAGAADDERRRRAQAARGVPRGARRDAPAGVPRLRHDRVPDDHPGRAQRHRRAAHEHRRRAGPRLRRADRRRAGRAGGGRRRPARCG